MLNYPAIPIIVVICYIAITAIKSTKIESRWYPIISCAIGMIAAVAMYYILPDFIGATSLVVAVISGGVSGLAATGSNQVLKQLLKSAEDGNLKVEENKVVPLDTQNATAPTDETKKNT